MFLRKLFGLVPADPFTQGLDLFDRGHLRRAVAAFAPLLQSQDEAIRSKAALYTCEAYLQLGDAIVESDGDAALNCYEAAADLQPTYADIQDKIGALRLEMGHHELAEGAFRRALAINPRFFRAHLSLIAVLLRAKGTEAALPEIQDLRRGAPDLYVRELGDLENLARAGDRAGAESQLEAIHHRNPSPREVQRQAALKALREGEPAEAVRVLEAAVGDEARFPDLLQLLGLAYGKLDRHADAERVFRAALEIHPGYQKARINLALALMEQRRLGEAEAEFESVLADDPDHPLALGALEEIRAQVTGG